MGKKEMEEREGVRKRYLEGETVEDLVRSLGWSKARVYRAVGRNLGEARKKRKRLAREVEKKLGEGIGGFARRLGIRYHLAWLWVRGGKNPGAKRVRGLMDLKKTLEEMESWEEE